MWAPGDPGHWPVWPLGAEPRAPGVTGAECMGRERVSEKPRAGLALPPASRPSSGQKLSVHAAVSTRPTGSCFRYDAHQQWPRKTRGWQGSARLPLSQCSLAPPAEADLQLLSQEWVPSRPRPASQPVAATCWTAQPRAGGPEPFSSPLPPQRPDAPHLASASPVSALLSPLICLGAPVPQNRTAHTQTLCPTASHLLWPQSWLSE